MAEMVNATNTAISAKADGIALAVVDKDAFNEPVNQALEAGIPVVSYNADGAVDDPGTSRLAYIGQGLYDSGFQLGQRAIASGLESGEVVGFIATPGAAEHPAPDRRRLSTRSSSPASRSSSPRSATNADVTKGLSIIDAYAQGHPNLAGMLAVDAGSTQSSARWWRSTRCATRA